MPRLAFTPRASADVEEAYHWYEDQRAGLGGRFQTEIDRVLYVISTMPEAGPAVHRDLRRLLVHRFPYALYYRVTPDLVEVRGCLHSAPTSSDLASARVRSNDVPMTTFPRAWHMPPIASGGMRIFGD